MYSSALTSLTPSDSPVDDDVASAENRNSEATRQSTVRFYPVVWRWHFYAGLLTAPVLWILALTGAAYVFRTEITAWRDHDLLVIEPRGERLPFGRLLDSALAASGSEEIEAIAAYPEANRSIRFIAHAESVGHDNGEQRHRLIYVDPYSGEVLGTQIEEEDVFSIILDLHRTLLLGSTGRFIGELATSWGLILLGTGLYLWWPRGKENVGVWMPRVRGKTYAVLRDWHAVTGAYLAPLIGIVALTGLFFSLVWGTVFNTTVQKAGHWPAQWFQPPKSAPAAPGTGRASLDRVVASFLSVAEPGDAALIRFAATPEAAHSAFLIQDEDKNTFRMVTVDQYTGKLIGVVAGHELPFLYRVRLWAVSIHMGQIFGTPTKILALLASVALFALSFTGVWMWWRRRPRGRAGFPRRPEPQLLPGWGWGLIVATGILMPLAGGSMLLAAVIDAALSRGFRNERNI